MFVHRQTPGRFGPIFYRHERWISLFALFLLSSCAGRIPAPLPPARETPRSVFGGFVSISRERVGEELPQIQGELLAVSSESLYVACVDWSKLRPAGRFDETSSDPVFDEVRVTPLEGLLGLKHETVAVGLSEVKTVKLTKYDAEARYYSGLTAMGIVSTLSHGVGLIFSAPVWFAWGSFTTHAVSMAAKDRFVRNEVGDLDHVGDWDGLNDWSRYPQGMPAAIQRSALRAYLPDQDARYP